MTSDTDKEEVIDTEYVLVVVLCKTQQKESMSLINKIIKSTGKSANNHTSIIKFLPQIRDFWYVKTRKELQKQNLC